MNKFVLTALATALAASSVLAIPARRDVVHRVVQPDGSVIELTRTGDERSHYYLTLDKIPVIKDDNGRYCYATVSANGSIVAGPQAVNPADRTAAQQTYTATLDRSAITKAMIRRTAGRRAASATRRANQSSNIGLFASRFPHTGEPHGIVILVQFKDSKFSVTNPHEYYNDFLNGDNFTQHNGTGSCRQYFIDSSNGQFKPTFDVYGPVTLSNNVSYYGGNDYWGDDRRPGEMVQEACEALNSQVDFSKYDTDNDGYVDNVYVIYAGKGENSNGGDDTVWPHSWDLESALGKAITLDGVYINDYGCGNEWDEELPTGIGTFCHEFGHVMGLPDLYNTSDDNAADAVTPGDWSIMDYGSYNNDGRTPPSYSIYERNAFGWIDPIVIDSQASISLENIHDSNTGAVVLTSNKNEFFLFENRQQTGWDTYLPGHGLIIWHIDFDQSVWTENAPNNTATHQRIDIEEAGGRANNESKSTMASYPFPGTSGKTSFTDSTSPSMKTWSGTSLGLPITDIAETNGIITFDVAGGNVQLDTPVAKAAAATGNGFTLSWNAVDKATSYIVNVYTKDNNGNHIAASGYSDLTVEGITLTVTRLQPETRYYATVAAARGKNLSETSDEVDITTTEATFDMFVPVATAATDITANSFTANWQPVNGANDYLLTVIGNEESDPVKTVIDFGSGSKLSIPEGWTASTTDIYGAQSTGYYGSAAPALKLTKNGHYLQSPVFDNDIVSISFWVRFAGQGNTQNYYEVMTAGTDGTWETIYSNNPDTKASVISVPESAIPAGARQVKVVFNKSGNGNLALDDLTITTGGSKATILAGYDHRSVGNVTSHNISGLTAGRYSYNVTAVNAAGLKSLESDFITLSTTDGVTGTTSGDTTIITTGPGTISVYTEADTYVTVTDLTGRCIATAAGSATFTVTPGFYIISANTESFKVQVR
ncbi:MAG: M6 family metalloprotease domain-containing protein [Odoribacter sp.]|nr:M6 family metalloprotease domain-containing protein [Odoribacter sp.]